MIPILRSIAITTTLAALVGLVFWSISGEFIKPFVLTIIIQFVLFWIFNTCSSYIYELKATALENERIAEFTKQGIEVGCSYCRSVNLIPVRFDEGNDFTCINCDKENAVYIGITVTQKTTPLNVTPITVNTLDPAEQQALDQLGNG